jgi:hypothetical protein
MQTGAGLPPVSRGGLQCSILGFGQACMIRYRFALAMVSRPQDGIPCDGAQHGPEDNHFPLMSMQGGDMREHHLKQMRAIHRKYQDFQDLDPPLDCRHNAQVDGLARQA